MTAGLFAQHSTGRGAARSIVELEAEVTAHQRLAMFDDHGRPLERMTAIDQVKVTRIRKQTLAALAMHLGVTPAEIATF